MKRKLFVLAITAMLILSACGAAAAQTVEQPLYYDASGGAVQREAVAPQMMPTMAAAYDSKSAVGNYDASGAPIQERLVIQNADLTLVVKDPKAKMDAVSAMAVRMGGFVVSSNLYETYTNSGVKVPEGSIVIRVPVEKLDDALKEIKGDAVEVQNENRSGQDVTQSYTDLESRLRNLESAEKQLTEIMSRAEKTEDVMMVFNQLTQIRSEIEIIKGQMQYYEQSADLSAISLRLVAEETIKPIEIGGWKPEGVVRDAVQALINFLQSFVDFLIWFVIFVLPMLIVILIPLWLIWLGVRAWLKRGKKQKPAPPAA
jgi:hypothetical protein